MAAINPLARELVFKIVFYGPGLGGKTTSLQHVHDQSRPEHRGKMVSLATAIDRTLYFDFLPLRVPKVRGMGVRLQLFTVPGQVYYNATRKLVLTGADGVVFVADSQAARADANQESFENLRENLAEQKRDLADLPHVFQYNKRDLRGVLSVAELDRSINPYGAPAVPTVATTGEGVFETLELITRAVLTSFDRTLPDKASSSVQLSLAEGGLVDALRDAEAAAAERVVAVVKDNFLDSAAALESDESDADFAFDSVPPPPPRSLSALYPSASVEGGESEAFAGSRWQHEQAAEREGRPTEKPAFAKEGAENEFGSFSSSDEASLVATDQQHAAGDHFDDPPDEVAGANRVDERAGPALGAESDRAWRATRQAAEAGAANDSGPHERKTLAGVSRSRARLTPRSEVQEPPAGARKSEAEGVAGGPTPTRLEAGRSSAPYEESTPRQASPSALRERGFSFAALWEGEKEAVQEIEAAIIARDYCRALALLDVLSTRTLASAAALLGGIDTPRDMAVVPVLLGLSGPRYLAYRALVRDARAGAETDERTVLAAYAFVIELRLARANVGLRH